MNEILVKSPAKINIGLNVINKRNDGFHNIETIFYPLNLYDEITLTKSDSYSFKSNDETLNKEKTNLINKAKELLEYEFRLHLPVKIILNKNIPIGAGLGGGSSNAASTLISLVKLFDLKIEHTHLSDLALKLGSDVPFFLNPIPSYAESRGEVLKPLKLSLDKYLLIINPAIQIATKWAFNLITPHKPINSLSSLAGKSKIKIENVMSLATNDFEKIVFEKFPKVKAIKEKALFFGAEYSMMTGTGSTVWAMFNDKEAACQTELYFKKKNYFTFIQNPI